MANKYTHAQVASEVDKALQWMKANPNSKWTDYPEFQKEDGPLNKHTVTAIQQSIGDSGLTPKQHLEMSLEHFKTTPDSNGRSWLNGISEEFRRAKPYLSIAAAAAPGLLGSLGDVGSAINKVFGSGKLIGGSGLLNTAANAGVKTLLQGGDMKSAGLSALGASVSARLPEKFQKLGGLVAGAAGIPLGGGTMSKTGAVMTAMGLLANKLDKGPSYQPQSEEEKALYEVDGDDLLLAVSTLSDDEITKEFGMSRQDLLGAVNGLKAQEVVASGGQITDPGTMPAAPQMPQVTNKNLLTMTPDQLNFVPRTIISGSGRSAKEVLNPAYAEAQQLLQFRQAEKQYQNQVKQWEQSKSLFEAHTANAAIKPAGAQKTIVSQTTDAAGKVKTVYSDGTMDIKNPGKAIGKTVTAPATASMPDMSSTKISGDLVRPDTDRIAETDAQLAARLGIRDHASLQTALSSGKLDAAQATRLNALYPKSAQINTSGRANGTFIGQTDGQGAWEWDGTQWQARTNGQTIEQGKKVWQNGQWVDNPAVTTSTVTAGTGTTTNTNTTNPTNTTATTNTATGINTTFPDFLTGLSNWQQTGQWNAKTDATNPSGVTATANQPVIGANGSRMADQDPANPVANAAALGNAIGQQYQVQKLTPEEVNSYANKLSFNTDAITKQMEQEESDRQRSIFNQLGGRSITGALTSALGDNTRRSALERASFRQQQNLGLLDRARQDITTNIGTNENRYRSHLDNAQRNIELGVSATRAEREMENKNQEISGQRLHEQSLLNQQGRSQVTGALIQAILPPLLGKAFPQGQTDTEKLLQQLTTQGFDLTSILKSIGQGAN